jgi:hypothetical protein
MMTTENDKGIGQGCEEILLGKMYNKKLSDTPGAYEQIYNYIKKTLQDKREVIFEIDVYLQFASEGLVRSQIKEAVQRLEKEKKIYLKFNGRIMLTETKESSETFI